MPTYVVMTVPAHEIALSSTIERLDGCEFRVEENVFTASDLSVSVWISSGDSERVGDAVDHDPSVAAFEVIRSCDAETLVGIEVADSILLPRAIIEKVGGTVQSARGGDGSWVLEARFPDRESLSVAADLFSEYGVEITYRSIEQVGDENASPLNELTDAQREVLETAIEMDYFDVPRGATLEEIAAELDVSHQALSERLRRAQEALATKQLQEPSATETEEAKRMSGSSVD